MKVSCADKDKVLKEWTPAMQAAEMDDCIELVTVQEKIDGIEKNVEVPKKCLDTEIGGNKEPDWEIDE